MRPPSASGPADTEIAAEYVLRVLAPDAHRAAAMRCVTDPDFAQEVRIWEDKLAPLMDEVDEIAPDPATKTVLMARLFGEDPSRARGGVSGIWRGLAVLGFAAAAALAFLAFAPDVLEPPSTDPRFVAELTAEDDSSRLFALLQPASGTVDITWTARDQPLTRDYQLWALVGGTEPVSIAVLPPGPTATFTVPRDVLNQLDGLILAISDEPLGGSPTDQPTGDVVALAPVSGI